MLFITITLLDEDDSPGKKTVSINQGEKVVNIKLPIDILKTQNKCSHPELRTLYLGTVGKRTEWLKVIGKSSDSFNYQCYYCQVSVWCVCVCGTREGCVCVCVEGGREGGVCGVCVCVCVWRE